MDKNALINRLFVVRKLSSQKECEEFDLCLMELEKIIDVEDVGNTLKIFYDETEQHEMMFGLIHLIEQFDGKQYLNQIAKYSPDMSDGHNWALCLNIRILNHAPSQKMYGNIIKKLSSQEQRKILNLLLEIKCDNEQRFGTCVDEIIAVV